MAGAKIEKLYFAKDRLSAFVYVLPWLHVAAKPSEAWAGFSGRIGMGSQQTSLTWTTRASCANLSVGNTKIFQKQKTERKGQHLLLVIHARNLSNSLGWRHGLRKRRRLKTAFH
eukprot:6464335-Amphidinium_carterae.2